MPEATLYLFDGYNLFHAGGFSDVRELIDRLASFVALRGARGVLVFDGTGTDEVVGGLDVRYTAHADTLLERLAAEHRLGERVCLISSDAALRGTAGQEVTKGSSKTFLADLDAPATTRPMPGRLADRLDAATRDRLERLRRGNH